MQDLSLPGQSFHGMTMWHGCEQVPDLLESAVYLCGPEAFMDGVKTHMENLGLPSSQIFTESFSF